MSACRPWFRVVSIAGLMIGSGCLFEPSVGPVNIQAYRCSEPGLQRCDIAGELIPAGTLPPIDEAFVLVARYRGKASRWTLMHPSKTAPDVMDSLVIDIGLEDSASVWI